MGVDAIDPSTWSYFSAISIQEEIYNPSFIVSSNYTRKNGFTCLRCNNSLLTYVIIAEYFSTDPELDRSVCPVLKSDTHPFSRPPWGKIAPILGNVRRIRTKAHLYACSRAGISKLTAIRIILYATYRVSVL
jgi:hypothetical protein